MKTVGYINEFGKYVKGKEKPLVNDVSSMYKDWSQSVGRKEYFKEIIQPHIHGKPNPEFVRAYPEYSKKYWSQEEIDKILREQV